MEHAIGVITNESKTIPMSPDRSIHTDNFTYIEGACMYAKSLQL